ncbi:Guanine-nucleotide dissociation stimulator CDC25 domain-containing protein [Rozella allomycis CSF55]|uniref:Guanine-nucleotide dissociation stimulator CDC25 domain-containing protein n=1 Tax=Rozella allomycis (strain CSF55) TaxID=988480 RepID=A0A075AW67_ROZAC|nr:Guanine-nucleotide dissociation stimulator CDC25 domain-containing protein [Rozella allomycis CSF55]|eukprot:EPZ32952.1 Guanine-nucleotide dissociation stimulator CDC25 domain-containing protein [Rozella allomycis CSF55]
MELSDFENILKSNQTLYNVCDEVFEELNMDWEKDVHVWDEIWFMEETVTKDNNGEVSTASINRMVEVLAPPSFSDSDRNRRRTESSGNSYKLKNTSTIERKMGINENPNQTEEKLSPIQKIADKLERFKVVFFFTYKHFTTAEVILKKLFQRFEVPSFVDTNIGFNIQNKVVENIRYWLHAHPKDFTNQMLRDLEDFTTKNMNSPLSSLALKNTSAIFESDDEEEKESGINDNINEYVQKMKHELHLSPYESYVNTYFLTFSVPGYKNPRKALSFCQHLLSSQLIAKINGQMEFSPLQTDIYQIKVDEKDTLLTLNMILCELNIYSSYLATVEDDSKSPILFLKDVHDFKGINDVKTRGEEANTIYEKYLTKTSKFKINVDEKILKGIESLVKQSVADPALFDEARNKIYYELMNGSYAQFMITKQFKDLSVWYLKKMTGYSIRLPCSRNVNSKNYPDPILPKGFHEITKLNKNMTLKVNRELAPGVQFIDIDDVELARQMAIIAFDLFVKIQRSELLHQAWSKPKLQHEAPNLMAFINRFNSESAFLAVSILSNTRVKARAKVMDKFIRIAYQSKVLRNYSTAFALLSALNSASVNRLKHTKNLLPKPTLQMLNELESFFISNNNYKTLRDALANSDNQPTIPSMAIYLQDLTFIEDGNPSKVKDLINFEQKRQMANVLSTILSFQELSYNFIKIIPLNNLLQRLPVANENQLYQMSLACEPRGADPSSIL